MSRTNPRLSRRSFVSALLASLVTDWRGTAPLQPQAARMTPPGEAWSRFFLWTGFIAGPGLPVAA